MIIERFKIIEHFINKELDIECGIYHIETKTTRKYYIVQTKNDYKAIMHYSDRTELENIREDIIEEIKELLRKEVENEQNNNT